jgi:primary-amine oxidase
MMPAMGIGELSAASLLAFATTTTLMNVTPGPAVMQVVGHSMSNGWRPAQASILGIFAANGLYCALSVLGLGALILAAPSLFEVLKWCGVSYLAWLGVKALRAAVRPGAAFMDVGEFGFGALSSPLKLGLDVPENAVLLDGLISAALPDPTVPVVPLPLPAVVGVFERVTGNPIWRHYEFLANGAYEGRAEVELMVRMIAQVGNYDYLIDWVFTQHGAIRVDVGLTGIDIPKGVRSTTLSDPTAAADTAFGTLVAPRIVAPFHSDHFNFRLDVDVDGRSNSFVLGRLKTLNVQGSPRKSVWVLDEETLTREKDARLDEPDVWKVVSTSQKNARGYPTSFVLESHGHANPLLKKADFRRAGFIEHALWVTAFDADERFASGDTPNQNPDEPGLPRYVSDNESIVNRDIVLWHTVTFHHVTAAEDYPVLSREHGSFELKPHNFFDRNPALDLRRAPFEVLP